MMPEMDGVETLHKIRQKPGAYYQSLPVIAFTANAIGGAREMFVSEGFNDFIAKPIELSVLERILRRYIPAQMQIPVEEGETLQTAQAAENTAAASAANPVGQKMAGLPEMVVNNTPKYLRRSKVPIVKAKIGPKIMTLMCDADIFPLVPVKKEVKASVSGIYITSVKGLRGPLETPQKKKGFFARMRDKAGKK